MLNRQGNAISIRSTKVKTVLGPPRSTLHAILQDPPKQSKGIKVFSDTTGVFEKDVSNYRTKRRNQVVSGTEGWNLTGLVTGESNMSCVAVQGWGEWVVHAVVSQRGPRLGRDVGFSVHSNRRCAIGKRMQREYHPWSQHTCTFWASSLLRVIAIWSWVCSSMSTVGGN